MPGARAMVRIAGLLFTALGLLVASRARATVGSGGRSSVRNDVYMDEQIVVVSPTAHSWLELGDKIEIDAGFGLDVLTGATPVLTTDAITSATYFSETRRGANAAVTYRPRSTWDLHASTAVSLESDHETVSPAAGASTELFHRMSTLGLDYAFVHERVGLASDPSYQQMTLGHMVDLRWAQILRRGTAMMFIATGQLSNCDQALGCHANPYRRVPILTPGGGILMTARERHPDRRLRGAAAVRLRQYLGHDLALHGGYRFYGDDWNTTGHTGDLALVKTFLGGRLRARVEGRFTWQEPASFYRNNYEITDVTEFEVPSYRSADREVTRMYNGLAGVRFDHQFALPRDVSLGINTRVSRIWYRYLNYSVLDSRNAWIIGVGLQLEY